MMALLLPTVILVGCSKPNTDDRVTASPIPVAVVSPGLESAEASDTRYPTTIARDRETNLSFRVGGVITRLPIRIGDHLRLGEDMARLDATPYQAARVRAAQDVAKLERAAARSRQLVPAGAVPPSVDEDNVSTLEAARAALRAAHYDETSAVVRSPFASVVLNRQVEVGETVSAGQPIARIADLDSALIARVSVPLAVAATVHCGDFAQVFAGSYVRLRAIVRHVGAAADPKTGAIEVELTLPRSATLPSGLAASTAFEREADGPRFQRLPAEALIDAEHGNGHVFVIDVSSSTARRVAIVIQGFDGEALRVSGLDPSAQVITYGAGFLRNGDKVAVSRQ
jgi:RND family efflux transporter MFP subunit